MATSSNLAHGERGKEGRKEGKGERMTARGKERETKAAGRVVCKERQRYVERSRGFQSKLPTSPTKLTFSPCVLLSLFLSLFFSRIVLSLPRSSSILIPVSLALAGFPFSGKLPRRVRLSLLLSGRSTHQPTLSPLPFQRKPRTRGSRECRTKRPVNVFTFFPFFD